MIKNCLLNCQRFGTCRTIEHKIIEFNPIKSERDEMYARFALTCEDYKVI